jgi:hypothetical protein
VSCGAPDAYWQREHERTRELRSDIVAALQTMRGQIAAQQTAFARATTFSVESIDKALAFYKTPIDLEAYAARRRKASEEGVVALSGFVPFAPAPSLSLEYPELFASEFSSRAHPRLKHHFMDPANVLVEAGGALEDAIDRLFPLGPYRRAPQRLYIFTGTTPPDVGYAGNLLPDLMFRKPALVRATNDWLDRLDIGYHLVIEPVGTRSNDLFEVRLRDTRRPAAASVAMPDVGFGISQLLPFVVQVLASRGQTITIEQPEVHVHPRLQADLADLLIEGIQPAADHRFIIETHSEHLVLRLLRRIRETTAGELPEGHPGLRPEQLGVVYLQRGPEGAEVHPLRVDETGEFIDPWPKGFFEERARELF